MSTEKGTTLRYVDLQVGDPAPWFNQRASGNPNYSFSTAGGRYVVLCFHGSAIHPQGQSALAAIAANRSLFDDETMCFFGVSIDPADETTGRAQESIPGIRYFWDFDGEVGRQYGALPREPSRVEPRFSRRFWLVLDPTLRVIGRFDMVQGDDGAAAVMDFLRQLPPPDRFAGFDVPPPILVLPNVFEPQLCAALIDIYEKNGGEESGFMREVDGKTVLVRDSRHKRRKDCIVTDPDTVKAIQTRILRRVKPEILKIYSFDATRMERYLVGCYAAEDEAHFRAHRDNTTKGTAHRRFAVSINLNDAFEGGEVSFPEYGRRGFKAPPGGAVVFPCALLHAVSQVTSGRRYAFLPFLYDDAAARVREANSAYLEAGSGYKAEAAGA
jgi:peroxiredoxin/predicted 2-oxoglutarate/Fe(II)-dependent dioxygenase YbiX